MQPDLLVFVLGAGLLSPVSVDWYCKFLAIFSGLAKAKSVSLPRTKQMTIAYYYQTRACSTKEAKFRFKIFSRVNIQ
jgi:hypothetical protein